MSAMDPFILILTDTREAPQGASDRLLEHIEGEPLLRRIARRALATGRAIVAVIDAADEARAQALIGLDVGIVAHPRGAHGQPRDLAQAMIAGLRAIPAEAPVLVVLAENGALSTAAMQQMLARQRVRPDKILRAADEAGHSGYPLLFPPRLRADLLALQNDQATHALIEREGAVQVILPEATASLDPAHPSSAARGTMPQRP